MCLSLGFCVSFTLGVQELPTPGQHSLFFSWIMAHHLQSEADKMCPAWLLQEVSLTLHSTPARCLEVCQLLSNASCSDSFLCPLWMLVVPFGNKETAPAIPVDYFQSLSLIHFMSGFMHQICLALLTREDFLMFN